MLQNPRAEEFTQRAQQAMAAGQHEEAARLWEQALAASPEHPQALLHLGQHALQRKDFVAARALLERAAKASPRNPVVPLNLAFVFRAAGDTAGEMNALTQALAIDPYFYPALLSQGALQERLGKARAAAGTYRNVLKIAPPQDQVSAPLRAALAHAEELVRRDSTSLDEFLRARTAVLRERHPTENWDRMNDCRDVVAGKRKIYSPQPAMLHVPYLPPIQFYDNADFPWLGNVEAATDVIREEFLRIFQEDNQDGFRPYIDRPAGVPLNQWAELNRSPRWSVFSFWQDGARVERNCERCPRTADILETVPMCAIPNFAPNVVFSLLAPKTTIPAHCGDTNARLIVHLPLILPGNCRFRVGSETREWKAGQAWIFDDTMEHEAWNDSDDLRVILMIDVWNPYLTAMERDVVCELLNGVQAYLRDE